MKTKLPKFSPAAPLTMGAYNTVQVKQYGKPPKGYRWVRIGEKIPDGSIHGLSKSWDFVTGAVGVPLNEGHLIIAAPLLGDVGSEADFLRLRVLSRTSKKVEFVIDSQKLRGFPLFVAENGVHIQSLDNPEVWIRNWDTEHPLTFFTRGTNKSKDDDTLTVTPAQFELIRAAVAELNEARRDTPKVAAKVNLAARVKELEAENAELKTFKAGIEALVRKGG